MKEFWHGLLVSIAIIIASLILGANIVRASRIIGDSIKAKETVMLEKVFSELGSLKKSIEQIAVRAKEPVPEARKMPEPAGSKKVEGVTAGSNPIKGNADAPVLIVEFSDFQCPYSKRFYQSTFSQIEKEYILTGKVKFAYRDFPLEFHREAKPAAIAARCAGKQDRYWQMFDKLMQGVAFDKKAINKYARELGLNQKAFRGCLAKPEIKEAMEADFKDAVKFGVAGTPAFFINGRFIGGAYPFEAFKEVIEEELKGTRK